MRKIISILILVTMLCTCLFSIPTLAASEAGMTFSSGFDALYVTDKQITALPHTLEATITVPSSRSDTYEGDILAWYDPTVNSKNSIVWDLMWKDNLLSPRLLCASSASGSYKEGSVVFKGALENFKGQTVHLALTLDSANDSVKLYVNGSVASYSLVYEYSVSSEAAFLDLYDSLDPATLSKHSLGGDGRPALPNSEWNIQKVDNYRYFHGAILNAAAFSDVRTQSEINADKSAMPKGDSALLFWYNTPASSVGTTITDASGNGYDLKGTPTWFSKHSAINDYAYSFAVIGDTQVVSRDEGVPEGNPYYSENYKGDFAKIFDYIVDNKDTKNIKFAFHMGDVTDWSNPKEWKLAMENINKLNGKIPYNIVRGNHDTSNDLVANYTMDTFVSSVADGEEYGTFDGNTLNTYQTLTIGKVKYLMLSLDMGPCKAVIEWANGVVASHPNHNVIISTHSYLHSSGAYMDDPFDCSATQYNPGGKYNGGSEGVYWDFRLQKYKDGGEDYLYQDATYMLENLVKKHENICMVLCGHECSDDILKVDTVGEHGNKIVQLLIDAQCVDRRLQQAGQGHAGMVAMLYFSEDGRTVSTEYYSTIREQYFKSENIYTFELDLVEPLETDELSEAISTAEGKLNDGKTYTASSLDDLNEALAEAKAVLARINTATQNDIDEAAEELTEAISKLRLDQSSTEKPTEKPTGKPTGKPTAKPTEKATGKATEKATEKAPSTPSGSSPNSNSDSATHSEAPSGSPENSGCGAVLGGTAVLATAVALCFALRKKEDQS